MDADVADFRLFERNRRRRRGRTGGIELLAVVLDASD
jgi:hypothetical protein